MKTLKTILRYSIGIIILFFVFKISSKSLLSSFLLLIPSVLIIPYTDNLIKQKVVIPKIIKYLVSFLSLVFGMDIGFEADKKIGSYAKEPLPNDFSYTILEDKPNDYANRNKITLEINQKLTVGQIATLAEEIYNSKPEKERFYIFYLLPKMKIGSGAWATSHFEPQFTISIIGSSIKNDIEAKKITDSFNEGEIIGKWIEEQYTATNRILYRKNGKIFMRCIYKLTSIQVKDYEMIEKEIDNGTYYALKYNNHHKEYYIHNAASQLEFYNKEGKNFTIGYPIN